MNCKVYEGIAAVMAEMAQTGIDKSRKNQQQGYSFRGIDDVYAALAPVLSRHKLCILPRVTNRDAIERPTKNGGLMIYTILTVEFDIVSAEDGSKHTVCTVGEASDSGDKSSNKAMSAAYKYMAFQAFCIPLTGEDNDADLHSPEFVAKPSKAVQLAAQSVTEWKSPSAYQAKKDGKGERYNALKAELQECATMTELGMWAKTHGDEIGGFPAGWQEELRQEYAIQREEIEKLVAKESD